MSGPNLLLATDAVEYAYNFSAGHDVSIHQDTARWAISRAYTEVGQAFGWAFLQKQGRVFLRAPQTTGTVAYDHAGHGSGYDRVVTLSGATWPTWAVDATIRIDDIACRVESLIDTTNAVLDAVLNPGADIAAGETYRLYPHWYALPNDFARLVRPWNEDLWHGMKEVDYETLMGLDRFYDETGTPEWYCIRGVEDLYGQMGLYVHPDSDAAATIDYLYERRPREVKFTGHSPDSDYIGTITVTAGSAAVGGTTTAFTSDMAGSILRISRNSSLPTGMQGSNPYLEQRSIVTATSSVQLTIDAAAVNNGTNVGYSISDPIDIDPTLHNVFLASMCKHIAVERRFKDLQEIIVEYEKALYSAKKADKRSNQNRVAGFGGGFTRRLHDQITGYTSN
jgi:hypothetical protein